MTNNPALLLLGPTGSGKSPLGDLLEERGLAGRRCLHFDFGEQLRRVVSRDVPNELVSRKDLDFLRRVLHTGALLEDQDFAIAGRLLQSFLAAGGATEQTWVVLNGLPRHVGQARAIDSYLTVREVVDLRCSEQTVLARIAGNTGGDRTHRVDDDVRMVRRKLALYHERTKPLAEYYVSRGVPLRTLEVEADTTTDAMWRALAGQVRAPAPRSRGPDSGFTLVELLVVIAIIAILVVLLIPAAQTARETARRLQCKNHLKQLGVAMRTHDQTHGTLPSGGWGWFWVGDPDRGTGPDQPGGWVYTLLPYLEQQALFSAGSDGDIHVQTPQQLDAAAERQKTPLPVYQCPTRRRPDAWPVMPHLRQPHGSASVDVNARTDYAACAGDHYRPWNLSGPASLADGDGRTGFVWPNEAATATGISFLRSQISLAKVRDGTTYTYMLGEKYLNSDSYFTGRDGADNESMYCGYNNDNHRTTYFDAASGFARRPMQDRPGFADSYRFGSAHSAGFNVVLCDGSVHTISYTIDAETHRRLGHREDGQVVDAGAF
jgi:prepilin-type N-terminal cleavage/methylation domain-containing protein